MIKLLLLLLPIVGYAQVQQPRPSEFIDVKNYHFTIELNDSTDRIKGIATITATTKKSCKEFQLDLVSVSGGKGMEVTGVQYKNSSLKFSHQDKKLTIALPSTLAGNEIFSFSVHYAGIPKDGLIISKNLYGDRTFFADNWPNRGSNWIPVIDHPADKASVEWSVIAPTYYEVVANGIRVEEAYLNKKQKLTRYKEEEGIAPKVMVIGVAHFAVEVAGTVTGIPIESWVYPQNRKDGFYDYALAVGILDFFQNHIGPYPYKKLANVQSKTTFGGLENASAIFYFEKSVTGKRQSEMLLAHEIAHQWFGNSASEKDWSDVWLSEGFATYFTSLYAEYTYGDDRRKTMMTGDRLGVIDFLKTSPTPIIDTVETDPMKLLNSNSYGKGGWVLHMLRRDLGTDVFWKGIRNYYKNFQGSNAFTSDFRKSMEEVSGKDLTSFFQQWFYKPGHPVLSGKWTYDEKKKTVNIALKQTQKTQVFKFPLQIGILTEGNPVQQVSDVYIDKESQNIEIPVTSKPLKITLDPNVNLLFEGSLSN